MRGKSPIGGREITREQLLTGLPNPKKWKQFSDRVYAKFRAKPEEGRGIQATIKAIHKGLERIGGYASTPSAIQTRYAKAAQKRATAQKKRPGKRAKRTVNRKKRSNRP
jgi:hypothetical protein